MIRSALLMAVLAAPSVWAQVQVHVAVPVPGIRFEVAPTVVEVEPGIRVVPDYEEEVFFYGGRYWTRRNGHWWRTGSWRGGWVEVRPGFVPVALVRIPPGRYRRWHAQERRHERQMAREEWKEQRREDKRERREMRGHGPAMGYGPVR